MNRTGRGRKVGNRPGICLKRLRKTTKILMQDSRYQDRDFKPEPPENTAAALTNQSRFYSHEFDVNIS